MLLMTDLEIVALLVVIGLPIAGVFSIPIALILTHHRRKMEELRQRREGKIAEEIRAEFTAVRAEIQALRDTTMQYDLSFDSALQHLERRMAHLEQSAFRPAQEPSQIIEMNRR
ncbi:MAG TPA: hypothetical protein VFB21_02335 [Chthonomonadaceae bacterium]|jgi:hypothetical protein|nr:hypothetical protein [Chthonomonadaceae bacterium]